MQRAVFTLVFILNINFNFRLNMFYHLDIEQQLKRIMNKINFKEISENKSSCSNGELNDICDGAYYKFLLESDIRILIEIRILI